MHWKAIKRIHPYYLLIVFCAAAIAGVISSLVVPETFYGPLCIAGLCAFIFLAIGVRRAASLLLLVFLIGLSIGLYRGESTQLDAKGYSRFFNQPVQMQGTVSDDITTGPDGSRRLKLKDAAIAGQNFSGEVWVSVRTDKEIKRSDRVYLEGVLKNGFGSYAASLQRAEMYLPPQPGADPGREVRDAFASAAANAISQPQLSLGLGFLLGLKTALPEELDRQIQILGLTHVVVASGYNLTILVAFARRLFQKVSKYLSALVGGSMIFGFILITGFSPSMSRAGLVAGLSLLAWYYGRKIHPMSLLLAAASATLLIKPSYIWGDIGWYLSFAAFFGILVLAPLIHDYFWGVHNKPSALRELIVSTFSAQIATLPIVLFTFGNFSLYSLLANALVLPLVPLSMLATFVAGSGGLILPEIAGIAGLPAEILLGLCIKIIEFVSSLPNSEGQYELAIWQLAAGYGAIVAFTLFLLIKTKHNFLKDKLIVD